MRLYPRAGQTVLSHDGVTYAAGEDGGLELPEHVALVVHRFHEGKRPLWETDIERQERLIAEELERRKDPATLLDAVQQLVTAAQAVTAGPAHPDAPARPARPRKAT